MDNRVANRRIARNSRRLLANILHEINESNVDSDDSETAYGINEDTNILCRNYETSSMPNENAFNRCDHIHLSNLNDNGIDDEYLYFNEHQLDFNANDYSFNTSDSDDEIVNNKTLEQGLLSWYHRNFVSKLALTDLLKVLKETDIPGADRLPKCAETLLHQLKSSTLTDIISVEDSSGVYTYFGIQKVANVCFNDYTSVLSCDTKLNLYINIDGVSLFKSTNKSIWPISVKIPQVGDSPFLVGFYLGSNKPVNNVLLTDLVKELQVIEREGLFLFEKKFVINNILFICDAPARALIKCIKSHNGYFACERCEIEGDYLHDSRVMVYDEFDCHPRTNQRFRDKVNEDHHKAISSPIENLTTVDMVTSFPLDYMHLVLLGSFRRLLYFWVKYAPLPYRVSGNALQNINATIVRLEPCITSDFSRKSRTLDFLDRLKATELRELLLYRGVLCFADNLEPAVYKNFLLLHVGIFIACSSSLSEVPDLLNFAQQCLKGFVTHSVALFGRKFCVYNIHSLIHLCDDISNLHCPLDELSCFCFENFFIRLKKVIRSPYLPDKQVVNCMVNNSFHQGLFRKKSQEIKFSFARPVNFSYFVNHLSYKNVCINSIRFSIKVPDCFFASCDGQIYIIRSILCSQGSDSNGFLASQIRNLSSFYDYPCQSSLLKIFKGIISTKTTDKDVFIPFCNIETKYMGFPIHAKLPNLCNTEYLFMPLNYSNLCFV